MKTLIVALMATAGITFAGVASAQADMAQKYCGSCHAVDTKKMGPAFKDIAKKYKGNASAEADLVAKVSIRQGPSCGQGLEGRRHRHREVGPGDVAAHEIRGFINGAQAPFSHPGLPP